MIEINNKVKAPIKEDKLEEISKTFLEENDKSKKTVSLAIVEADDIREMNKKYRGKNRVTDVLSFTYNDKNFLGEIIISWEQIQQQARAANKTAWQEFVFIFLHGLLHLLGYIDDTEDDRKYMIELAKDFIEKHKNML